MLLQAGGYGYLLRVLKEEWEKRLYAQRVLYIGIRREWNRDTKLLFIGKTGGRDAFTGSGVIDVVISFDLLSEKEKNTCLENNWSYKLIFKRLARFCPPLELGAAVAVSASDMKTVPQSNTPSAIGSVGMTKNMPVPQPMHGAKVERSYIERIEDIVPAKIIY